MLIGVKMRAGPFAPPDSPALARPVPAPRIVFMLACLSATRRGNGLHHSGGDLEAEDRGYELSVQGKEQSGLGHVPPGRAPQPRSHSHSIVAGGLPLMS